MNDRPIIFSAPMVRALIDGRKTQTRRVLEDVPSPVSDTVHSANAGKPLRPARYLDSYCSRRSTPENPRGMSEDWCWWTRDDRQGHPTFKVRYAPGDRLWVRETLEIGRSRIAWQYRADSAPIRMMNDDPRVSTMIAWAHHKGSDVCSPIHMPRWASRLTLAVTAVRVERLRDIAEGDAIAEGCRMQPGGWWSAADGQSATSPSAAYAVLWDSLHGSGSYGKNPWVAALAFAVSLANIDAALPKGDAA